LSSTEITDDTCNATSNIPNEINADEEDITDTSMGQNDAFTLNSLIDFYALIGTNDEIRTVVKNQVNQAGDWIARYNLSPRTQTALASYILGVIRSHQMGNPNAENDGTLNRITTTTISRAIDMTIHVGCERRRKRLQQWKRFLNALAALTFIAVAIGIGYYVQQQTIQTELGNTHDHTSRIMIT
jgi:hypothetical protein